MTHALGRSGTLSSTAAVAILLITMLLATLMAAGLHNTFRQERFFNAAAATAPLGDRGNQVLCSSLAEQTKGQCGGAMYASSIRAMPNTGNRLALDADVHVAGIATVNNIKLTGRWTGWPNGARDRAEISNDTAQFKTLMLVGNKSAGGSRKVSVWDQLEFNGNLNVTNTLSVQKGVDVLSSDPGALIEKRYGNDRGNRYGVGQGIGGRTRVYAAQSFGPATVGLGMARPDGGINDVLVADNNNTVTINGSLRVCDKAGRNCRVL